MGDHGVGHTAFKRINKFNDDKTEQVWELFREEFARASVAEDGETSWRCAAGIMSVDDINQQGESTTTPGGVVMGDQGVGHTAFKRIEKFNDDKTEQVWELFREEFARASELDELL